jgi:hypothetical protein
MTRWLHVEAGAARNITHAQPAATTSPTSRPLEAMNARL